MSLSPLDDYPDPPDRPGDPPRRHQRPQLLRPLLLQHAPAVRRPVLHLRARPVPEPRRAGRVLLHPPPGADGSDAPGRPRLRGRSAGTAWTQGRSDPGGGAWSRLRSLRFVVEETEHGIAIDVTWTGSHPALLESPPLHPPPRARHLRHRSAWPRLGQWEGTMAVAGEEFAVTPDDVVGRPRPVVGRAPGRRAGAPGISAGERRHDWLLELRRRCGSTTTRSSTSCRRTATATAMLEHGTLAGLARTGPAAITRTLGRPEHDLRLRARGPRGHAVDAVVPRRPRRRR